MEFTDFLIEAKKNTYASSRLTDKLNKDGSKELIFEKDNYIYVDKFCGYNPFSGQETIFENTKFIWSLNYYGLIETHLISEKDVYNFLKKALLKVETRFPYRGPNIYKENDFEYFCDTTGILERFIGKERIDYKGETIYTGVFHGGIIKAKLI
jgi:hypothetical protein